MSNGHVTPKTMFKYFNLLPLLLCINLVFSYEYIDDATGRPFHSFGKNFKRERTSWKRKERHTSKQKYGYDKNAVEFDVARFIQPDEETVAEEEDVRNRNQQRPRVSSNNDYSSLLGMNMEEGANNRENQDYLNFGDSPANPNPAGMNIGPTLLKDSMKQLKMDEGNAKYDENIKNLLKNQIVLPDQNPVHNPQKKCVFKSIKFPFFSHNKTEALKPKKTQKRKAYSLNVDKKSTSDIWDKPYTKANPISQYKIKRSYETKLCPACKKKYIESMSHINRHRKTPAKIIHNSRQFYQKHPDAKIKEYLSKNVKYYFEEPDAFVSNDRQKRQDTSEPFDKDKRLQLLEEIQRKVDSVKVTIPKFNKPMSQ